MKHLGRIIPLAVVALGFGAVVGCASSKSDSPAAGDTGTKADSGTRPAAKVPSTPPSPPKVTSAPTSKPSGTTKAPSSPAPTTDITAKPLLDPAQLTAAGSLEVDAKCPAGLDEGKGFCLPGDNEYLAGCVGGKYKALDCDLFNTPDLGALCLDDDKAGCYGIALTSVTAGDLESAKTGKPLEGGKCQADQEGKGFCVDTGLYVCTGGKVYGYDCGAAYSPGFTCRVPSFEPGKIGCWLPDA